MGDHWRIVVILDAAPPDPTAALQRLEALVQAFQGSADTLPTQGVAHNLGTERLIRLRLDQELRALADRAKARGAAVVDDTSPVVWGLSDRIGTFDDALDPALEELLEAARHATEELDPERGLFVRRFAGIYRLVLLLDDGFSELHARGAVGRSLALVERLVLALPPVDPPPAGAKVLRIPQRRNS
jgi:hypothetical protein